MNKFILNLRISGITCGACIKLIKKGIGRLDGVADVIIKDNKGETTIISSKKLAVSDIISALSGMPYKVSKV